MRRLFLLFLLSIYCTAILFSQGQTELRAQQAASGIQNQYKLDEHQTQEVRKIQERKFRNLAEIENLRMGNPTLYLKKRQGIAKSTTAGIKKLLRADQLIVFESYQNELQHRRSAKIAQLKESGKKPEEINLAILEIE